MIYKKNMTNFANCYLLRVQYYVKILHKASAMDVLHYSCVLFFFYNSHSFTETVLRVFSSLENRIMFGLHKQTLEPRCALKKKGVTTGGKALNAVAKS